MDKTSFIQILKRMAEDAEMVKVIIRKEAQDGRILVDEETHREVWDWILEIESNMGVADSYWNGLSRMGPSSRKFVFEKK